MSKGTEQLFSWLVIEGHKEIILLYEKVSLGGILENNPFWFQRLLIEQDI